MGYFEKGFRQRRKTPKVEWMKGCKGKKKDRDWFPNDTPPPPTGGPFPAFVCLVNCPNPPPPFPGEVGAYQKGFFGPWAAFERVKVECLGRSKDRRGPTSPMTLLEGNRGAMMACLGRGTVSKGGKLAS